MRILNISFKNINSLEGEGQINFDQGAIADSGVFAITGPNGSGKTSILDVITLGLYGETFRFDKPAEHIITKHAQDSFAQVDFAFDGEKYRSTWQVKRTDLTAPDMQLMRLNGNNEVLAESPYQVRQFLMELIGMDFHKFSKSIVLPQGDFAAFLNALDSERMDILEKISGAELYNDYRRQLETRHQALQEKLTFLEQETGLIPLLSADAIEALEQDLHDFTEISADLKLEQQQLAEQQQQLQHIASLNDQLVQLGNQQQPLQQQLEQLRIQQLKIATGAQAAQLQDDLYLLNTLQAQAEVRQSSLNSARFELQTLQQQLANAQPIDSARLTGKSLSVQNQTIGTLKLKVSELKTELPRLNDLVNTMRYQLTEKQPHLLEVENWLQTHQGEAILLTDFPDVVKLRNLRSQQADMKGAQKSQGNWSKTTSGNLKKNRASLASAEARIKELHEQVTRDQATLVEISAGKSFGQLNELLADQQVRVKDFEELFSLASIHARLTRKRSWFGWFNSPETEPEIPDEAGLQARLDTLKLELDREENISRALEKAIGNEALLKKLVEPRGKLVEGVPCFLCGSLHHPYTLKPPALTDSKKALADQRGKVQVLRSTINDAQKQLLTAQKRISQLSAKQKFLLEKRGEWLAMANRLNIQRDGLDITNIGAQERLMIAEADELERIKSLVEEHTKLQRNIARANTEIEEKHALLGKLRMEGQQLDATWSEHSPEIDALQQKYQQIQDEEHALVVQLEKQLKALGEKLPGKGKEDKLFDILNTRRQDYQIHQLRQKGLREEIAELQEKLQTHQESLNQKQKQLTAIQTELSMEEAIGVQLSLQDKQQIIANHELELREQLQTLESFQTTLTAKAAEQGFASIQEVIDVLKLAEKQAEIAQQVDTLNTRLFSLDASIAELERQCQQAVAVAGAELTTAELDIMSKQVNEKWDITEQEINTLTTKLEKQQQYRQKYQTLETELNAISQQFLLADEQLQQINAEPGGLRKLIQQALIDKLLSETNLILEKISGRYYVRSAPSEHGLALAVEDTRQNNAHRLPKTLSGGESFVISLALALGLAEIANNGKSIESLFIDEGFGNLDAESLYLAMGALEGLKIQGKTVGVISHVEGVKKRIKTQIELIKKPNGLSELRLSA